MNPIAEAQTFIGIPCARRTSNIHVILRSPEPLAEKKNKVPPQFESTLLGWGWQTNNEKIGECISRNMLQILAHYNTIIRVLMRLTQERFNGGDSTDYMIYDGNKGCFRPWGKRNMNWQYRRLSPVETDNFMLLWMAVWRRSLELSIDNDIRDQTEVRCCIWFPCDWVR